MEGSVSFCVNVQERSVGVLIWKSNRDALFIHPGIGNLCHLKNFFWFLITWRVQITFLHYHISSFDWLLFLFLYLIFCLFYMWFYRFHFRWFFLKLWLLLFSRKSKVRMQLNARHTITDAFYCLLFKTTTFI